MNDQFTVVKSQVLMMESLSSINKVNSLNTQEESNNTPAHVSVIDKSSILTNDYEAKKIYCQDRGASCNTPKFPYFFLFLSSL